MKNIYAIILMGFFLMFSHLIVAQDYETAKASEERLNEADTEYSQEENVEPMSIEELKEFEKENKAKEKEARTEAKEAKKLENQIKRSERAEARALKARREADLQSQKTKSAIENYNKDQK